jgi:hypothetical protein
MSTYREIRQRIAVRKQSGSYVVTYPAGPQHPGYSREKVFSVAIGSQAHEKAMKFATAKALEIMDMEEVA